MGIIQRLIGSEDFEDQDEIQEEEIEKSEKELKAEREEKKAFSFNKEKAESQPQVQNRSTFQGTQTSSNAFKVILVEPKEANDSIKLADYLKNRRPVIVNLESVETETAKKIFSFLQGAAYALNGDTQRIANNIYIFTPYNVNVNTADLANTISERGFAKTDESSWRG